MRNDEDGGGGEGAKAKKLRKNCVLNSQRPFSLGLGGGLGVFGEEVGVERQQQKSQLFSLLTFPPFAAGTVTDNRKSLDVFCSGSTTWPGLYSLPLAVRAPPTLHRLHPALDDGKV